MEFNHQNTQKGVNVAFHNYYHGKNNPIIGIVLHVPRAGVMGTWFAPKRHWEKLFDRVVNLGKDNFQSFSVSTCFPYPDGVENAPEDPLGLKVCF